MLTRVPPKSPVEPSSPRPLNRPFPAFPRGQQGLKSKVQVVVQSVLNREGVPIAPVITAVEGHAFYIYESIEAMQKWRFEPATLDGQPIPIVYTLTINFAPR